MQLFPRCQAIIPLVQNLRSGRTVEQVLEQLQSEAKDYPEGYHQLAAIRYYLHVMLWRCEQRWQGIAKGVTNYKALLDLIERCRNPDEQVCIVTFNYDTLIEDALPVVGVEIRELLDYISNDRYKLLKLHGSVKWGRGVDTPIPKLDELNPWQVANELINRVRDLKISDRFHMVTESCPMSHLNGIGLFPAIAIPVET